jgi:hypothetical protein
VECIVEESEVVNRKNFPAYALQRVAGICRDWGGPPLRMGHPGHSAKPRTVNMQYDTKIVNKKSPARGYNPWWGVRSALWGNAISD